MVRQELREALKRKIVYRNGKRKTKWTSTRDGYKVVYKDGKPREVRMSASERRKKSRSAKKAARRRSSSSYKRASRKAKRSKRKRG
jgi:hypothetical protein